VSRSQRAPIQGSASQESTPQGTCESGVLTADSSWQQSVGELFGVELPNALVDGLAIGEVDASLGERCGHLFGGAPSSFIVERVMELR